jgi:hypothetical protein
MDRSQAQGAPFFTQPIRQVAIMLAILAVVGSGAWVARLVVESILFTNLLLNAAILGVFAIGIISCFWQLVAVVRSVGWIQGFTGQRPGVDAADAPLLLAPLAALLGSRGGMQISTSSQRSILDSVATRIDESREITRYLGNLLIFLGLLGTFWGLATTVPAMVETIRNLSPQEGESGSAVFGRLMGGLESQLGGIGTAFSSSLLGLAGSLVIGLLDLFAGHAQNRFFRELEEWLSTITRVGLATDAGDGDATAAGVMAQQVEALAAMVAQSDANRALLDQRIGLLAEAVGRLAQKMEAETGSAAALGRIAEGQAGQLAALERLAVGQDATIAAIAQAAEGSGQDPESRMRLRSIDVQLLRILEELAAGRQEALADVRADLSALTAAVRSSTRGAKV